jgi:hypothetical protein
MRYIKKFESFRLNRDEKIVNEEFIGKMLGGLLGGLKKKLSLGFSKMFGSAKKADKVIEEYKVERTKIEEQKVAAFRALAEFLKSQGEGAQKDDTKKKELENNLKKQQDLYTKSLDLTKQKFDIKLKEVTDEEKNDKIKNYINLKKIEMEQEFLAKELQIVQGDLGLTDDIIKNSPAFKEYYDSLNNKAKESEEAKKAQVAALSAKGEEGGSFNFEEAIKNKDYKWEDSKFAKGEYKFEVGEEIKIFISESDNKEISTAKKDGSEYKGTTAYVFARKEEDDKDSLRIAYKKDAKPGNTFTISKGKVVTTKKEEDEKQKSSQKEEEKS